MIGENLHSFFIDDEPVFQYIFYTPMQNLILVVRRYSKTIIKKIRREVLSGKSKYQVALEKNLDFSLVYRHTKDIPSHKPIEPSIWGKAVDLLKQLLLDGYVHSTKESNPALRRLKNNFPMIQRSQIEGKGIYYLNDKNRQALQSVLEQKKSKLIHYNDLSRMAKVFDIYLTNQEKKSFIVKKLLNVAGNSNILETIPIRKIKIPW